MKPTSVKFKKKRAAQRQQAAQQEVVRVRLPRAPQTFGIVEQRLGGSRMKVRCLDAKTRICRIPGRLKRHLWVREGDIIIVQPWELSGDQKGDVIYKYSKSQAQFIKKKGYLKKLEEFEEF